MKYQLGIDVGGTFTDFMLISTSGEITVHKTLSTPEDSSKGVLTGIQEIAELNGTKPEDFIADIETIVHGTTVATNALLTLKGAKTALITTKGVRDALEMRRGIREEQYNNHYHNVKPLVPRYLRLTVNERIDGRGKIVSSFNESELIPMIRFLKEEKVEAVAVCFMNAFINSIHEERAIEFLKKHLPSCFITASTEILPSIRFYERTSTVTANAYLGPVVANYLGRLTKKLDEAHFSGTLLIMQSNGGVVLPQVIEKSPAVTVLSGPAAAPTAGSFYAGLLGYQNCITVDMGGTSFDASLIVDGQSVTSTEGSINRHKIALPALEIVTIGAGGGSIGWIDNGGLLQMGPQSAGASPGPVCYNKGGTAPTCTDANLVLGYLNPDFFAGGKIKLDLKKTKHLLSEQLGAHLNLSLLETVAGMYRIINTNMAQGVRQVSIEKGYDPREFLFIVAGGAGAIHAGEICKELEIPLFMVPNVSSIFCAAGMLLGDLKHDYIRSYMTSFAEIDQGHFLSLFQQMKETGVLTLKQEGIEEENIEFYPVMDLRYVGQYHELQLPVAWQDILSFNCENIQAEFHQEHNRLFGYCLEENTEMELINVRLRVLGKSKKPDFSGNVNPPVSLEAALKERRWAYVPELNEMKEVPVYDGDLSLGGNRIPGPAIIEKVTTSILVGESYDCLVDDYGSFIVYNKEAFPEGYQLGGNVQ